MFPSGSPFYLHFKDWLHELWDQSCNTQFQTNFFIPKDSFLYPILDELHLFGSFCASQKVTKIEKLV